MGRCAWVTLATNDAYSLGALVLAHSLRRVGTKYELAVLVTPGVTEMMREKLAAIFSVVQEVNVLDSKDEANLALLARPELGVTFTKLHCWRLTQYEKCVFVDADTLVVRNCDELFEREELSAAPDVGWPDCFNSGVFVFKPSQQTFASVTAFAAAKGSFDGGDQGLLNMYFSDWAREDISKHLPFIYNMCSTATYSYLPAFKQFGEDVRIIHFIGITKPWLQYFDTLTGIVQPPAGSVHLQPLLQLWWNIFCEKVHHQLSPVMAGLAGALAQMTLGEPRTAEQIALEEHMRKQSWEQGQIDYMGRDSFDNIWKKICETLSLAPQRLPSPPKESPKPVEITTDETTTVKSVESVGSTDEVDKPIAGATTSLPEEQSLITDVSADTTLIQPEGVTNNTISIKNNESILSKLAETDEQIVNITLTSVEKDLKQLTGAQDLKQEITDNTSQKSLVRPESPLIRETPTDFSPAESPVQASEEATMKELPVTSLPKEEVLQQVMPVNVSCKVEQSLTDTVEEPSPSKIVPESSITTDLRSESIIETKENIECSIQTNEAIQSSGSSMTALTKEQEDINMPIKLDEPSCENINPPQSTDSAKSIDTSEPVEKEPVYEQNFENEKHAEMLSAASEVVTISPVPIQVAESVLQTEPKESISDSQTIPQEALSSTVTPIQEFIAPSFETATIAKDEMQLNGSTCIATTELKQEAALTETISNIESPNSQLEITQDTSPSAEQSESNLEKTSASAFDTEKIESPVIESTIETLQQPTKSEQEVKDSEGTAKETVEPIATVPTSDETMTLPPIESPVRPSRTKELNIPATPTITEATPPTSPPISVTQDLKSEEKITKKALKKAGDKSTAEGDVAEAADADNVEKKTTKKVVKKVLKKSKSKSEDAPDDGAESSSSPSKQKKTVKVIKKGTKSSQTLGTDVSVPETPPPGTSDAPIPPKRKAKSTTTKSVVTKKSDVE